MEPANAWPPYTSDCVQPRAAPTHHHPAECASSRGGPRRDPLANRRLEVTMTYGAWRVRPASDLLDYNTQGVFPHACHYLPPRPHVACRCRPDRLRLRARRLQEGGWRCRGQGQGREG